MTRLRLVLLLLLLGYAASGWYVVGGDEQAVVRRFGRVELPLRTSGLHYDLPWPWCRVDRVNLTAARTLTIGVATTVTDELMPATNHRPPLYLTGDQNLLLLRISVQYRLQEEQIADVLFGQTDVMRRLRLLVESELTEVAGRCGVDYLQTFGLAELNQRLTRQVAERARAAALGVEVDQVTLERVEPPVRVQADFLDVANARAEAAKALHDARTFAEQRLAAAASEAEQLRQQAVQQRVARVAQARGAAARFERVVTQLDADAARTGGDVAMSRAAAIQRLTWDSLRQSLGQVAKRVVIDAAEPIDLNLPGGALP